MISGSTEDKSDQYFVCNKFIKELYDKKAETFYGKRQIYTNLETLGKVKQLAKISKDNKILVTLPKGTKPGKYTLEIKPKNGKTYKAIIIVGKK